MWLYRVHRWACDQVFLKSFNAQSALSAARTRGWLNRLAFTCRLPRLAPPHLTEVRNETAVARKSVDLGAYIVAALGTLSIVAALVGAMIHYTRPAPLILRASLNATRI